MSYTLNDSNLAGSCDFFTEPATAMRFYLLSVYPKLSKNDDGEITQWSQRAERLKFTVQSEFLNEQYNFEIPESTQAVVPPLDPPTQEKRDEYFASFEVDSADAGSNLYISATASLVALAALTLY